MPPTVRDRLLTSALKLFRRKGIAGTGVAEIIAESGAARGSIYAHFPGGKAELAEQAVRAEGEAITEFIAAAAHSETDLDTALHSLADYGRHILTDSDFEAGCPIVAAAVQSDQAPAARTTAGEIFTQWQDACAQLLQRHGIPAEQSRSTAALLIAAIEGGIILARAQRSMTPLDRITTELTALLHNLPRHDSHPDEP